MRVAAGARNRRNVFIERRAAREGDTRAPADVVFFDCRIRDFDSLADTFGHDPEMLGRWVRCVMTALIGPVEAAGGIVGTLVPGGFSAFFPAPQSMEGACRAALDLMEATDRLNLTSEPQVSVSLGIAAGIGVEGDFGTEERPLWTAIGLGSQIASALARSAARYGVTALAGPVTAEAVESHFALLQVDWLRLLDGSTTPLYALLAPPLTRGHPKFLALRAFHTHILDACQARDWQQAREKIAMARALSGANTVLCDLYLERIASYELHPPPEDWPGVIFEVQI